MQQPPANAPKILEGLRQLYPDAACALKADSPFQLLVATVLSAQTTDERVNQTTPALFEKFPTPSAMATASEAEVEKIVRPLGFGKRRAGHLVALAQRIESEYSGCVPADPDKMQTLSGVGRKTANVVMGNSFGQPAITVDTHVGRLARRFGWTQHTDPAKAEIDIQRAIPQPEWTITCHRIIDHGRQVCHSRKPDCDNCALAPYCPKIGVEIRH